MKKVVISIIMYLIAGILLGFYAYFQVSDNITMTPIGRVIILVISTIFMYIGAIILSRVLNKHKKLPFKINLAICFLLYLLLLSTLTLFDDYFRRGNISFISWNRQMVKNYLNESFNIVPFKTINMYFRKLWDKTKTLEELRYYKLSNQICITNQKAVEKLLSFKSSYIVK